MENAEVKKLKLTHKGTVIFEFGKNVKVAEKRIDKEKQEEHEKELMGRVIDKDNLNVLTVELERQKQVRENQKLEIQNFLKNKENQIQMNLNNIQNIGEAINTIKSKNLTLTENLKNKTFTDKLNENIYNRITTVAKDLAAVGEKIEHEFGIPIVNKRISVTPIALVGGSACKTPEDFATRLAGSPIRRIGFERWLRNIAVALGNAPASPQTRAALRCRQDDPSALVREHVAWALQQSA